MSNHGLLFFRIKNVGNNDNQRKEKAMLTFFLLLILVLGLGGVGLLLTLSFGGTFLIIFGDIIICVLIILGIVKLFEKK